MSKKEKEILYEMYRRAFAASEPPADFDELLANAEISSKGRKIIPYMDHECDRDVLSDIFNAVIKEYKVPDHAEAGYNIAFYLGCSPKTKR